MSRYVDISPYEKCRIVLHKDDSGFPVSELPTVDAVKVVRCGECKWTIKDIGKYPRCRMNRDINGDCRLVSEHGFCSYGERKEANE